MTIYFTSDPHFGHWTTDDRNIIKFCNRPFKTIEEHDEALIKNWNSVVGHDDTIYVLGDFALGRHKHNPNSLLSRLNGREKYLVFGNHDGEATRKAPLWTSVDNYKEIVVDGTKIILFHYKMATYNGSHKGTLQLFGHSHNSGIDNSQQMDVGVDCWDYKPTTLEKIKAKMKTMPSFSSQDYHGRR